MSLHSWLKSLKQSSRRRNRKSSGHLARLKKRRRMFVELLEDRRLLAGDLDASFGNGGIATTNFIEVANTPGWSDSASSVALQPALQGDGKIVVAGTTQPNGAPLGAISRYNGDGSLDASFSNDGKVSDSRFNTIQDVAIQPDGKIVVVGRGYPMNGAAGNFAIGRFEANGDPDTDFGTNGIVLTNPGVYDTGYAVALLSDGKILVTGQSGQPGSEQPVGFTVQQFNSDGTVDTSFGSSGQVRTFYSPAEVNSNYGGRGNVAARDVVVQPDGKIVVAGYSLESSNRFAVVRYNADGSLDTSFDTDGRVVTSLGLGKAYVASVALQNDGKVVVGGYFDNGASGNADFALVRYNTDGSLDTTFDGDGKLILDYGGTQDYVNDVKVQSDGSIVVTGSVGNALAVARFNPDGSPDSTFGTNGLVTTAVQASAHGSEVVVQPNGGIVVAGTVNNGNGNQFTNRDFVVVRYNGISNTAPIANAGGPYTVAEGSTVVLNGSGSFDAEQSTASLIYEWDLDADGIFGETGAGALRGDEVGIAPTFSTAGLDDSTITVSLRVTDDSLVTSDTANAEITVTNVAPSNLVLNSGSIFENDTFTLTGTFDDPGTLDVHTVTINWGEGAPETHVLPVGARSFSFDHQYLDDNPTGTPLDSYSVTVTIADDDADCSNPSAAEYLADSPVGFWKLNEAAGATSFLDSSGNGNHGASSGVRAPISGVPGQVCTAASFDGAANNTTSDVIQVPTHASINILNNFSVEAWVSWNGTAGLQNVVAKPRRDDGSPGSGWQLGVFDGIPFMGAITTQAIVVAGGGPAFGSTGSPLSSGVFHHLVGTFSSSAISIYVDGNFVASRATNGANVLTAGPPAALNIGREFATGTSLSNRGFSGVIDEVAVYNTVLNSNRVLAHYDAGTTPPTPPTSATTSVTVNNVDPIANAGANQTVNEGALVTLNGSFTDVGVDDGHKQEWSVAASNGQAVAPLTIDNLAVDSNGAGSSNFSFTPNDNGTYTVSYQVTDDDGGTHTHTATITVDNVDPAATDDAVTFQENDSAQVVDVLANDSDPAGTNDPLSVTGLNTAGTTGAVTLNAGQVSYSPDGFFEALGAGETTIDSFEYSISDGDGGTDTAIVTVTITGQNDAPTAPGTLSNVTVNQNAANSVISLTGLFHDVDANDTLTITAVSSSSGLVTAGVAGSSLTLDYQANQSGTATITVTATDGSGASVSLTFDVAVLSPAQQSNVIIQSFQQFTLAGKITAGVASAMEAKLDNSLKSYAKGNLNAAAGQLNALKNQIKAKVKPGGLTAADAALAISLIDELFASMSP